MKRGEIWWANLAPRSGSEQTGRRPVIILSHDAFNETPGWRSIIVVPLSTSPAQARRGPTVVAMPMGTAGLKQEGCAVCHQVTTIDRAKLVEYLGALPAEILLKVENALLAATDIRR
ncbi:MAG: type II toxin-antitoxin system PemK/MazF family toxin [Desulfobulbia bacterium]